MEAMSATDVNTTEFVDRYLQVWNEPDPDARRQLVRDLWAADAVEYTDANEYRGHEALEARVTKAHTQFVEEGGFVFPSRRRRRSITVRSSSTSRWSPPRVTASHRGAGPSSPFWTKRTGSSRSTSSVEALLPFEASHCPESARKAKRRIERPPPPHEVGRSDENHCSPRFIQTSDPVRLVVTLAM